MKEGACSYHTLKLILKEKNGTDLLLGFGTEAKRTWGPEYGGRGWQMVGRSGFWASQCSVQPQGWRGARRGDCASQTKDFKQRPLKL